MEAVAAPVAATARLSPTGQAPNRRYRTRVLALPLANAREPAVSPVTSPVTTVARARPARRTGARPVVARRRPERCGGVAGQLPDDALPLEDRRPRPRFWRAGPAGGSSQRRRLPASIEQEQDRARHHRLSGLRAREGRVDGGVDRVGNLRIRRRWRPPNTTPDNKGWIVDGSGGVKFTGGTWTVHCLRGGPHQRHARRARPRRRSPSACGRSPSPGGVVSSSTLLVDPNCTASPCSSGAAPGDARSGYEHHHGNRRGLHRPGSGLAE